MNKVGDIILLSVLWLVCSLPVVTMGTATCAAYYTAAKVLRHHMASARAGGFEPPALVSDLRKKVQIPPSEIPFFCISERRIRLGQDGAFSAYLFCTKLENLPLFFLLQLLQKMKCGQKSC